MTCVVVVGDVSVVLLSFCFWLSFLGAEEEGPGYKEFWPKKFGAQTKH